MRIYGAVQDFTAATSSCRRALASLALLASGCVDPLTAKPVNSPEWTVKNVGGYAATAAGLPPETTYGWNLAIAGDVARWRECQAVDVCGTVERTRSAKDVLALEPAGRATVGGEQVEVLRLSLAARPTYVVPYTRPAGR